MGLEPLRFTKHEEERRGESDEKNRERESPTGSTTLRHHCRSSTEKPSQERRTLLVTAIIKGATFLGQKQAEQKAKRKEKCKGAMVPGGGWKRRSCRQPHRLGETTRNQASLGGERKRVGKGVTLTARKRGREREDILEKKSKRD